MEIGMSPWSKIIALLIALLVRYARAEGEIAVHTDMEVAIKEGSDALLSCTYDCTPHGDNHTVVQWWKGNDEQVFIKNGKEVNNHPRVQWMGNLATCNASIVMREVLLKDSAQYRCEVFRIPSYNEGRSVVELHTLPSTDLIIYAPTEETTNVGNDVLLKCSYFCKGPRDKFTLVQWWRIQDGRDEKVFTKNGQDHVVDSRFAWRGNETSCDASISIKNASLSDVAQYRCEVTYIPSYKQGRKVMRLNVQAPPDTPIQTTPRINPTANYPIPDENPLITVIVVIVVLLLFVACAFLGLRYGKNFLQRCRQRREQRNNRDPPGNGGRNNEVPEEIPLQ
ncbi:uncharacterized protein LOC133351331 isoform X2 [Lethenteron reissneri]|uniref:uncharacterized protein LOC133351331 isoform X2 n=1 Tax=Lethenteron reissneri TaxID=7753 RepID=UPI002AB6F7E4|nr:uncharacterized protein LOC133351331 isoform X2 [Lethenteron reissneri]